MSISRKEIEALIESVKLTRPRELTCDECLKQLAEFAEHFLNGEPIPAILEAVEHHLAICPECEEEYQALLTALKDEDRHDGAS